MNFTQTNKNQGDVVNTGLPPLQRLALDVANLVIKLQDLEAETRYVRQQLTEAIQKVKDHV